MRKIVNLRLLVNLIIQIGFIFISFRAIQGLHLERYFRRSPEGFPLVVVLVSIAIGYACASFFTSFFTTLYTILNLL